jgi:hypothetical protein
MARQSLAATRHRTVTFLSDQPAPAQRVRIDGLSDHQLRVLGQVESKPRQVSDYTLGQLSAWHHALAAGEDRSRIEAALDRAKRAKAKPKRKSAVQIADEAVDRALARYDLDDDEDLLGQ